jgi:peptidoglycan/LPS O-acetylase OafA/YrhL
VDQTSHRRTDLDWLRVLACYLLIPFHTAMVFNPAPFYHVRNAELSTLLMIFCGFVSLWHMPLLFLLAGWSAFASYRIRGPSSFLRERMRRLAVPLVAGCVLLGPGIKYLELRSGLDLNFHGLRVTEALQEGFRIVIPNGLPVAPPFHEGFWQFLPTFYVQLDRFTWSHLWFLAYLLTFTAIVLPALAILARSSRTPARISRAWVYAPILPLVLIQLTLRERWPGPYNLVADWANFSFFVTFLIVGVVLARVPALENALVEERQHSLMIAIASVGVLLLIVLGVIRAPVLLFGGVAIAGWCCVAAMLGFMRAHPPRGGPFLDALAESALPIYLLHQPVIVLLGFGVVRLSLGIAPKFMLLLMGSTLLTLALYLQVRRFAVTRFLAGMRPLEPGVQSHALSPPPGAALEA